MATIYDVAKLAGVSPKTVSRVLNNDAPVRPTTRKAVEQAIAELGYIPLSAARAMRSHRSGLVGLITGAISRAPGHSELRGLPDIHWFPASTPHGQGHFLPVHNCLHLQCEHQDDRCHSPLSK